MFGKKAREAGSRTDGRSHWRNESVGKKAQGVLHSLCVFFSSKLGRSVGRWLTGYLSLEEMLRCCTTKELVTCPSIRPPHRQEKKNRSLAKSGLHRNERTNETRRTRFRSTKRELLSRWWVLSSLSLSLLLAVMQCADPHTHTYTLTDCIHGFLACSPSLPERWETQISNQRKGEKGPSLGQKRIGKKYISRPTMQKTKGPWITLRMRERRWLWLEKSS